MTDLDDDAGDQIDGRTARRQRNIDAVLDVVLEMFGEDATAPTIEQVAVRSGLSLRSLYRYFSDPGELRKAAIERLSARARDASQLPSIGSGSVEQRIADFVAMRLRLHEMVAPVFRAAVANAPHHARVRDQLTRDRDDMRTQFALQFAPELTQLRAAERESVLAAGDLVTQLDSIEYLRRHRQLPVADVSAALTTALTSLLT